jgi:type I restriction enzyme S subunit
MKSQTHNWPSIPLGDIAKCQGGTAFSPSLQGRTFGDIPFFKVSDMNLPGNKWHMRQANNYVTHADTEKIGGSVKPPGSIIFPKVGAAIHTNKKRLLTTPAFVDNNVMAVWSTDESRCRSSYLYLYFLTKNLSEFSNPGPLPSINNSKIYEQTVLLPPPLEQDRISAVIWKVQRAIEVEERLIANTRALKKSAMQQLFTRGMHGEQQKETDIGLLPQSWRTAPLGHYVTTVQYGLSVRGHETGSVPILRMNCQLDGQVVFRDLQFVDLDSKTLAAFRVNDGDLLFNRTNSFELVGRTAIFRSEREAVFASYLIRLTLDQTALHPEFVNYFFNQPSVQSALKKLASRGVSQANINATKLKEVLIPLASLDEQRQIAAILEGIDRKITVHERKRGTLQELFKTLLQELMTGRLRVLDLDIDASEVTVH